MNANWKLAAKIGISMAALLALSACRGGGGSAASAPTPTTVIGTAAKGLVSQGKVLVCRIVNGLPEADASCASGTTGADGSFSVAMSDGYTGPALIKVMAGANSTMIDETTGQPIAYNLTMRALLPALSGTATVYVTPFSEMAASAVGNSGITAANMVQAMDTVQANFGVDLAVRPVIDLKDDASDPAMLGKQANMVRQLTRVMMAARTTSSLMDQNGVACNAAGSSTAQVACVVSAMAGAMAGVASTDPTRAATLLAALNSQNVTAAYLPIVNANGTLVMDLTDMTSSASMQAAMRTAGMAGQSVAGTVTTMMQGMM
ncbi:hypothetical protein GALL_266820 [mine drainage metagenome]|uniref:Lipoprotein n=1 Tax=mine drainage metagenome TaxID=410659 RepID=A0A1J5R5Y1_9ZZZZ